MPRQRLATPEDEGEDAARRRLAEARVLQDADRAAVTPVRVINAQGKPVWQMAAPTPGRRINATAPLAPENGNFGLGFTPRSEWDAKFAPRSPMAASVVSRAPAETVNPDSRGSTYIPQPNELFQPSFKDKSGDATARVLSKTPGSDAQLDPVYAADVFRNAGDEKTAAAYEKYASTMDPSKYVLSRRDDDGRDLSPWTNPHFQPIVSSTPTPALTSGIPSDAPTASLTSPMPQTFGGKRLDLSLSSNAPAVPKTASAAEAAGTAFGASVRSTAGDLVNGVTSGLRSLVDTSGPGDAGGRFARNVAGPPGAPLIDVPAIASNAVDFVGGAGRALASGVSRSQAADFRQPTQNNPLPGTPTSPIKDIDRTPEAIARFGQTDEEFSRNKLAFSGF